MDNNEEAQPIELGLTVYLPERETSLLSEIWHHSPAPSLQACLKVLIRKAHEARFGTDTIESRPLVSLGQGEYRRDIMAEDC